MSQSQKNTLFEKFEIIDCLKKDANTSVYLALHIFLGKNILLKTLNRENIKDASLMLRFQREAKTLAKLEHHNIIKVLDFGTFQQFFYISFEYFKSQNLRTVLQRTRLSVENKKDIFIQMTRGLAYAHHCGVIHRDIKPENILVNEDNIVKMADFGLALVKEEESLTQQSSIVGTPSYMSPEQIRGEELTATSDLFSLAIIGYELFAGVNPFLGKDVGATLNNILSVHLDSKDFINIPEPESTVIQQLLQKKKNNRIQSAREVMEKLDKGQKDNNEQLNNRFPPKTKYRKFFKYVLISAVVMVSAILVTLQQLNKKESIIDFPQNAEMEKNLPERQFEEIMNRDDHSLTTSEFPAAIQDSPIEKEDKSDTQLNQNSPGRLFVQCSPWAHVFIDSQKFDTTPLHEPLFLYPGNHELKLEHPDFLTYVKNIRIEANQDIRIDVDLDTMFSYLTCNIYPWAFVYLDGDSLGLTPFSAAKMINPGEHVLTLKNQEFGGIDKAFYVERGDTFRYNLNFERLVQTSKMD